MPVVRRKRERNLYVPLPFLGVYVPEVAVVALKSDTHEVDPGCLTWTSSEYPAGGAAAAHVSVNVVVVDPVAGLAVIGTVTLIVLPVAVSVNV